MLCIDILRREAYLARPRTRGTFRSSWMLAVALPLWSTYRTGDYTQVMVLGIVLDVIAIPWLYVCLAYVKAPGDR
jgi:hypothetical protein